MNLDEVAPVPELHKWMADRELMHNVVKQHLLRAQARMKRQADKGRSERHFTVGDMVFLKLQPYIQSSLFHRSNKQAIFQVLRAISSHSEDWSSRLQAVTSTGRCCPPGLPCLTAVLFSWQSAGIVISTF